MPTRILVVDDAAFVRDNVKRQLRRQFPGLEILEAADGLRAQALLKQYPVDLVLSDWEMPGMSGEELLRWMREQEATAGTPFVMVSSRGERDHVVKAVEAGVSDYLSKPFSADELLRKTSKQLKKIGKLPQASSLPQSAGFASDAVSILTGGQNRDAGGGRDAREEKDKAGKYKGKAQLRFAQFAAPCLIRDLSAEQMQAMMQRTETVPALFEPAVVDMTIPGGETARINGYVHALKAMEHRMNSQYLQLDIRFVDDDPTKLALLQRLIDS